MEVLDAVLLLRDVAVMIDAVVATPKVVMIVGVERVRNVAGIQRRIKPTSCFLTNQSALSDNNN